MWYIIFAVIVLIGKYALFDPRINSALWLAYYISAIIRSITEGTFTLSGGLVLVFIVIIDCIRDIIIAKDYYGDIGVGIDPLYRAKSIASLLTYGLARVIFLFIVGPYINHSAQTDLEESLNRDKVIPFQLGQGIKSNSFARRHFYRQYSKRYYELVNIKLACGAVLSNQWVIDTEFEISQNKLEKSYPQNFLQKLGEMSAEGRKAKAERERAKNEISSFPSLYAYIDTGFYNHCKHEMPEVLIKRGILSPHSIAELDELECLAFLKNKDFFKRKNWIDYFVIFIMSSLVKEGIIEEFNFSDEILENHQYRHTMGAPMRSRNAEDNPLLALDDD